MGAIGQGSGGRTQRVIVRRILLCAAALAAGGCIVGDEKCSDNQTVVTGLIPSCECEAGYVPSPKGYGCEPCGPNEVAARDKCECMAGFARPSPGAACAAIVGSALGSPCSAAAPCVDPNPYCAVSLPAPICTVSGCTSSKQCPMNTICDRSGSTSFCRPPSGLGTACSDAAQCASFEAGYCERLVANACLVNGCASNTERCPNGFVCCDLSTLIGDSLCIVPGALVEGKCPGGLAPVGP
jgi:hypothetical protein